MGEFTRRYNRVPGADVPGAVARLRAEPGGEIRAWGSTGLVRTLAEHDLVDEYRLMVCPILLGTGTTLYTDGFPQSRLTLVERRSLASRVVVTTYRPARRGSGSIALEDVFETHCRTPLIHCLHDRETG